MASLLVSYMHATLKGNYHWTITFFQQKSKKSLSLYTSQVAHHAGAYPGISSMNLEGAQTWLPKRTQSSVVEFSYWNTILLL